MGLAVASAIAAVPLMTDNRATVAIEPGTELLAAEVKNDRVAIAIRRADGKVAGWVEAKYLVREEVIDADRAAACKSWGLVCLLARHPDSAAAEFDRAIRYDPRDGSAYKGRASACLQMDNTDRALADATTAIRLADVTTVARRDALLVDAYSTRGMAYARKGDLPKALADYDEALRLKPDFRLGRYHRGRLYLATGDLDNAYDDFTKALGYLPAYHGRALVLWRQGRVQEALADLAKALETNPRPEPWKGDKRRRRWLATRGRAGD